MTSSLDDDEPSGALPRLSRRTWTWVILGLAALTAVAAYVGWTQASQEVRWQDVGFTVESPTQITVTYEVYLYGDRPVECHVRALNENFAEVGAVSDRIDPSDGAEQRITTTITTVELATTAIVNYCEPLAG